MPKNSNDASEKVSAGRLFDEFERPTYEEWRRAAEQSLKGAPFEKKLVTKTCEGISTKPIYNPEDIRDLPHLGGLPGFTPYARGTGAAKRSAQAWEVSQEMPHATPEEVSQVLAQDLPLGLGSIRLVLDGPGMTGKDPDRSTAGEVGRGGVSVGSTQDLVRVLEGIDIEAYPLYVRAGCSGLPLLALLVACVRGRGLDPAVLRGCIESDPLETLALTGALPRPMSALYDEMAEMTRWCVGRAPSLGTIAAQGHCYGDAGASAAEELAFTLATGVEYLREMIARDLSVDEAAPRIRFGLSVGTDLFVEIAKLRAARLVWAQAVRAFGGSEASQTMRLHARTGRWSQTARDPYVNMLRGTTQTFSAVVGGADSVHTSPFDEAVREPDEFSRRVARNTQLVLKEESRVNQVVDPAGGSWYVEWLTDKIAAGAWSLFQEVEQRGGMLAALEERFVQQALAQTAQARARDLATRKAVLIGTNIYPNTQEKDLEPRGPDLGELFASRAREMKEWRSSCDAAARDGSIRRLEEAGGSGSRQGLELAIEAAKAGATLGEIGAALAAGKGRAERAEPLAVHRGAEPYEKLLGAVKEHAARNGRRPAVFLANMGPIPQHKARADFTTGFFEVGGFEVKGNDGFATPEEAADAAIDSGAGIAVICSSDPTYPELVPPFVKKVRERSPEMVVVLAGYPKDQIEAHREAGVDEFIHIKANNYEMLCHFLKETGVEL